MRIYSLNGKIWSDHKMLSESLDKVVKGMKSSFFDEN